MYNFIFQNITIIGVIVALAGNFLIFILWCKDRQLEKLIDKRVLRLFIRELETNLAIIEAIYRKEFRQLENKVFYSTINSHRLARFLGDDDDTIHTIFECYHTSNVLNGMIEEALLERKLSEIDTMYGGKYTFPFLLNEERNYLDKLIPKLKIISEE
jgi:hypothetical protein